jgi:hypothetical protein
MKGMTKACSTTGRTASKTDPRETSAMLEPSSEPIAFSSFSRKEKEREKGRERFIPVVAPGRARRGSRHPLAEDEDSDSDSHISHVAKRSEERYCIA